MRNEIKPCDDTILRRMEIQAAKAQIAFGKNGVELGNRPAGATEQGEGAGAVSNKPNLKPSAEKAYGQLKEAVRANASLDGATDDAIYKWVKENRLDEGERIPTLATWKRFIGFARQHYGEQKNKPKTGRPNGRSIVPRSEM